ncbi:MAG: hypothetical protein HY722_00375 [Planctomycetes bacterium]|nr:hypothetical protein [Planctomycetota bacterium]
MLTTFAPYDGSYEGVEFIRLPPARGAPTALASVGTRVVDWSPAMASDPPLNATDLPLPGEPCTHPGSRLERLSDLVAWLLGKELPVPFSEIRRWFPHDYGAEGDEAGRRMFERDKADLLEMGIPVRHARTPTSEDGYSIDPRHYYRPALELTGEELAVLLAAGRSALDREGTLWRSHMELALRKVWEPARSCRFSGHEMRKALTAA